jgi:hypothetical protein
VWFRFLGVGIVVFWGLMTALLIRAVYFPAFERLPEVDPGHVLELFIDHKEVTHLFFYREDGAVVGDVMLTPRRLSEDDGIEIGFAAVGEVELPNLPRQKLNWRGKLKMGPGPERKLDKVDISVRFTFPPLTVAMEIDPATMGFHYKVLRGGLVITDSRDDPNGMGVAQMQILLAAWGLNPEMMGKEKPSTWEARQGAVEIGGHRAGAYFMVVDFPGAGMAKLTFSEAGELLVIDTPLGYQLLSEAMRTPPDPLPY